MAALLGGALLLAGVVALRWLQARNAREESLRADSEEDAREAEESGPVLFGVVRPQRTDGGLSRVRERAMWGAVDGFCPRDSCTGPSPADAVRPESLRFRR